MLVLHIAAAAVVLQVEWDILAAWVVANNLASNNVVWLVQIPRLYNVYRDQGIIENFAQVCCAFPFTISHCRRCC
jgi:adenosine deaminase